MHASGTIRTLSICLGLLLSLVHCTKTPPEQQLRNTVAGLQADIQAKDAGAIKHVLAEDFVGPGGMDRTAAARLAQLTFLQYHDVGVSLGPLQVQFYPTAQAPDHASVRFSAVVTGGSGTILPDEAQVYQVQTGWRRAGDAWLLTSATWTP